MVEEDSFEQIKESDQSSRGRNSSENNTKYGSNDNRRRKSDTESNSRTTTEGAQGKEESKSNENGSKEEPRQEWGNSLDFLFSSISYCVGVGNIWRFPYLAHKYGGGAFLICYFVSAVTCVIPFVMMEVALGQFFGLTEIAYLQQICPIMRGAGIASLMIQFYYNLYFPLVTTWSLFYLISSFTRLPWDVTWAHCDHIWNTDRCIPLGEIVDKNHTSAVDEFWNIRTLHISGGLNEIGDVNWELLGLLLFIWVLCYFIIWKGLTQSAKVVCFTATFPYIIITILLIRAVTLEGAIDGLRYFVTPNWEMLKNSAAWIEGGTQIFFSSTVGYGGLCTFASYNKFNHNFYRETLVVSCVNMATSLYTALVTFSVLGYMAATTGEDVKDVVKSGPGLIFLVYPQVVYTIPGAPWWAMLFFIMMLIIAMNTHFCGVEVLVACCADNVSWIKRHKFWFTIASCAVSFLISLPMVTSGGPYIFELLNLFAASGMSLLFAVAVQVIAVSWVWGSDNLYEAIYRMTGVTLTSYWMICWKFIGPLYMMCIMVFYCVSYSRPYYEDVPYDDFGQALAILISCSSMVMVPGYAAYYIISSEKPLLQNESTERK